MCIPMRYIRHKEADGVMKKSQLYRQVILARLRSRAQKIKYVQGIELGRERYYIPYSGCPCKYRKSSRFSAGENCSNPFALVQVLHLGGKDRNVHLAFNTASPRRVCICHHDYSDICKSQQIPGR